jgi:hypothetical protein
MNILNNNLNTFKLNILSTSHRELTNKINMIGLDCSNFYIYKLSISNNKLSYDFWLSLTLNRQINLYKLDFSQLYILYLLEKHSLYILIPFRQDILDNFLHNFIYFTSFDILVILRVLSSSYPQICWTSWYSDIAMLRFKTIIYPGAISNPRTVPATF